MSSFSIFLYPIRGRGSFTSQMAASVPGRFSTGRFLSGGENGRFLSWKTCWTPGFSRLVSRGGHTITNFSVMVLPSGPDSGLVFRRLACYGLVQGFVTLACSPRIRCGLSGHGNHGPFPRSGLILGDSRWQTRRSNSQSYAFFSLSCLVRGLPEPFGDVWGSVSIR